MSHITPLDQEIIAWYESQTEETLRDLQYRFDAHTPRQAWKASFNDCAFPAQQCPGDSLAAPAEAGQGVCTFDFFTGFEGVLFGAFYPQLAAGLWSYATGKGSRGVDGMQQWLANAAERRA